MGHEPPFLLRQAERGQLKLGIFPLRRCRNPLSPVRPILACGISPIRKPPSSSVGAKKFENFWNGWPIPIGGLSPWWARPVPANRRS